MESPKRISLVGAISAFTCAEPKTTPSHVRNTGPRTEYCGKPGLPFSMVQSLHQSNGYIKWKLEQWRGQKCIPLFGAISALTCAGPQTTASQVSLYWVENGKLGKSGATFRHGTVFAPKQ